MLIAKKYFSFQGLSREKAGLARIRTAKKNHSSLLLVCKIRLDKGNLLLYIFVSF